MVKNDQFESGSWPTAHGLRNMITNGKGRMPKYGNKLTPEEIETLVQQIEALSKK